MFRFEFMSSDFNPLFLFLGDAEELKQFAAVFRDFEQNPRVISLRETFPNAEGRASLWLVHAEGDDHPYGLRAAEGNDTFTWCLNVWQAGQVAKRIDALTPEEMKSGNDILEFGLEGEIPIKVSRGEFTENFLTPKHHLHPDYIPPGT
ncbi:hypothetical protein SB749_17100 [Brevibacterium sp. SIMBA_078]|uniref:hypothetical protein n=1 Tax=Brevibacterium sp. SIMBA_078 TaxID=3085816 RepID=UPI00397A78DC